MSKTFDITCSAGSYGITIGNGILAEALAATEDVLILCDQRFAGNYRHLPHSIINFNATEEAKSLAGVADIVARMRAARATRSTTLCAIGGGVIQDLATLSAALYMRGITWRYLPTTLLAMVDSCVGGKSAINVGTYKNLVGNFYPPNNVIIDTTFIDSLNPGQIAAGLCEAAKICFARGDAPFSRFLSMTDSQEMHSINWPETIAESLLAKKWFVETDEFDQDERLLLNFGHTFGHAIEGASNYLIPHGIAVGLGIFAADALALKLHVYAQRPKRMKTLIDYLHRLLEQVIPADAITALDPDNALKYFESDKKHQRDHYAVILPDGQGNLSRVFLDKTAENMALIRKAFTTITQQLP